MADHRRRVYGSVAELRSGIDNPTPIVALRRVVPLQHARVYAKLEWYNPFGTVKDRVAAHLVDDAEARGVLHGVRRLVEATSGNTGMGLAMVAASRGYQVTTTVSAAIPVEKRSVLRFAGAQVVELADDLCPAPGQPEGAMALAAQLGLEPGAHQLDQYRNAANPEAHYRSTGPEIWAQTEGTITHFVAGLGTCGSITGTGRFLKEQREQVAVIGVHPTEDHDIPGVRSLRQLQQASFFHPEAYDGVVEIETGEAWAMARRLHREEGIIAGPSSGMALAGALRQVPDEPGVVAVVLFPDNIFKYASSLGRHDPSAAASTPGADPVEAQVLAAAIELHRGSPDHVDIGEVEALLDGPVAPLLLDVRTAAEFEQDRAEGSLSLPLEQLIAAPVGLPDALEVPILTLCAVGKKSLYATVALKAMGYRNVKTVMGGLEAWQAEGLPIELGPVRLHA